MSTTKAVFVLIHGAWHNHSVWDRVTPILKANGFAALTLDLPGAGANAIAPTSLRCSPFDPAAFAAERSPMAGVTQGERTQAVVVGKKAGGHQNGHILVGHRLVDDDLSPTGSGPASRSFISRVPGANARCWRCLACQVFGSGRPVRGITAMATSHAGSIDEAYTSPQGFVLCRRVGVRIRACGVATSLRRIERRRLSPIGNYAWKIWHGAAPLHPLHTGSRDSVDRSGSHDCDG